MKSEYVREEGWSRVKAAVERRVPVKEEMTALRREQSGLERATKTLESVDTTYAERAIGK